MRDGFAFWARVQERMDDLGIDLAGLARPISINYHTLHSAMKRGSIPKEPTARAVARQLGSPLRWLTDGEGDKTSPLAPSAQALSDLLGDLSEDRARVLLSMAESWQQDAEPPEEAVLGGAPEAAQKDE